MHRSHHARTNPHKPAFVIAAKTTEPHPKLEGTIYTAAEEVVQAGAAHRAQALPIMCDIRDEESVKAAVKQTVEKFGGIDICVNNASAISISDTLNTPMKRFDLMFGVNVRGTYMTSSVCAPHLIESAKQGRNPHILNLAPPLNLDPKWFKHHTAYTMADAAQVVLSRPSSHTTGQILIDDEVLASNGVTDLGKYAATPGNTNLIPDLFLDWISIALRRGSQAGGCYSPAHVAAFVPCVQARRAAGFTSGGWCARSFGRHCSRSRPRRADQCRARRA